VLTERRQARAVTAVAVCDLIASYALPYVAMSAIRGSAWARRVT
jgi:hypothetical protein